MNLKMAEKRSHFCVLTTHSGEPVPHGVSPGNFASRKGGEQPELSKGAASPECSPAEHRPLALAAFPPPAERDELLGPS